MTQVKEICKSDLEIKEICPNECQQATKDVEGTTNSICVFFPCPININVLEAYIMHWQI